MIMDQPIWSWIMDCVVEVSGGFDSYTPGDDFIVFKYLILQFYPYSNSSDLTSNCSTKRLNYPCYRISVQKTKRKRKRKGTSNKSLKSEKAILKNNDRRPQGRENGKRKSLGKGNGKATVCGYSEKNDDRRWPLNTLTTTVCGYEVGSD